ncbi:MAG TPA: class I SAM-dependent methyltransferase [Candidatus Acidoferrales bacterium]|nr:class I SAM-dependent methyltransferase [Candidatus Acidoferrales bacterium]
MTSQPGSPRPFRASGRRAGQRFDAQHGITTEALVFLGDLDPERLGRSLEFATHYEPTPVGEAEALLDAVPLPLDDSTFVDVGAGMGRVVFLAARRPFKTIVGIEISPALVQIARDNLTQIEDSSRRCRDVRLVRADAATYRYPRGNLVLYLFNPFRAPVLERVLARVCALARDVVLLYHTPLERETIERNEAFEIVDDLGFGAVYRRRPIP